MKIKNVREVEKIVSFQNACIYRVHDTKQGTIYLNTQVDNRVYTDKYIANSLVEKSGVYYAKFEEVETRDMTSDEDMAYHYLKMLDICSSYGGSCDGCLFQQITNCPISDCVTKLSEETLKGKLITP